MYYFLEANFVCALLGRLVNANHKEIALRG